MRSCPEFAGVAGTGHQSVEVLRMGEFAPADLESLGMVEWDLAHQWCWNLECSLLLSKRVLEELSELLACNDSREQDVKVLELRFNI